MEDPSAGTSPPGASAHSGKTAGGGGGEQRVTALESSAREINRRFVKQPMTLPLGRGLAEPLSPQTCHRTAAMSSDLLVIPALPRCRFTGFRQPAAFVLPGSRARMGPRQANAKGQEARAEPAVSQNNSWAIPELCALLLQQKNYYSLVIRLTASHVINKMQPHTILQAVSTLLDAEGH